MKRPFLAALLVISAMMISACQKIPDPCAGYRQACIAVTVEDGPAATFQLSVNVEGFGSTTPLTPRAKPDEPLTYPLRFAVKFRAFEDNLPPPDQVTVRVQALDLQNTIVGFAQQVVPFVDLKRSAITLRLGTPPDLSQPDPQDLSTPMDLATPDLDARDLGDGGADGAAQGGDAGRD